MAWQDDPIASAPSAAPPGAIAPSQSGAAAPPGASAAPNASAPAWMSDPIAAPAAAAPTAPQEPESDWQRSREQLAAEGYKPNAAFDWVDRNIIGPFEGFTQQANRALTMGLSDKAEALAPAVNAAVKKGWDYLTGQTPQAPSPSFSDAYHQELAAQRGEGEQYAANHPWASKAATTLGTVASVPLVAGTGGAPVIAKGVEAGAPTLAGRVLQGIKGGATVGAISGFGGANDQSLGSDLLATGTGAATGAAVGGAMPVAGAAAGKLLGNVDEDTGKLADLAINQYGIPVKGPQITNSPVVKYTYSQLRKIPFSGGGDLAEAQQSAFNKAVANTFGEDAEKITPEVLQQARDRIGGVFNGVAKRTTIPMTNDFMDRLQNVVDNARLVSSADSVAPIERQAMNIVDTAANNGGNIGGKAYIDLTAKGGPLDAMMQSSDSGIRQAGIQLRSALDDALQHHAAADDLAALKGARAQYKALKTVEPLTLRADTVGGATPSTGDISPAALRAAVNQSYLNAARAKAGELPLNDLAKIGQRFLKEPPDSGTATREAVNHGIGIAGGLGAAIAGHEAGIPPHVTLPIIAGTAVAGRTAGAAMRSNAYAESLVNRALGRMPAGNPLMRSMLPVIAATKLTQPAAIPLSSLPGAQ